MSPGRSSTSSRSKTVARAALHVDAELLANEILRVRTTFTRSDFDDHDQPSYHTCDPTKWRLSHNSQRARGPVYTRLMPITQTDWTPSGIRLVVETETEMATIFLSLEAQALIEAEDVARRGSWLLSRLIVPGGTIRGEAERLVKHWLSFYSDPELIEIGSKLFLEAFMGFKNYDDDEDLDVAPPPPKKAPKPPKAN
jgi:hypothetical protein